MDIKLEKKHPLKKYKYHIGGGFLLFCLIVYVIIKGVGPSSLRYDAENLQVSVVKKDKFMEYLDVEGIAQPRLTVKLNSMEDGLVDRIIAEEGSSLKRGDTILVLTNVELLRTIDDERDDLEKQQVSYQEKVLQMERKTSELKRNTLKTVYELERLSKQYNLDQEEFKLGIKSRAQLDVASDDYTFNKKSSKLMLEELKHDSLSNIIQTDLMRNDIKREEKKYLRSKERLDRLIVRAPVSGQLSFVSVIPGERVVGGSSIGEMKIIDEPKITTKVSEYYIDRISIGLPAFVMYQDKRFALKITKINPEIKDRLFEVDLVFTEEIPDNIRIGKSYRIQIELGLPEDALVVDKGSFYQATGGQWIFKLDKSGNRAKRVEIGVGRQNPRQYEVLNGLQEGDRVIVSGYDNFGDVQELILK